MFVEITEDKALCLQSLEQTHDYWGKSLPLAQYLWFFEEPYELLAQHHHKLHVFGEFVNDELVASCRVLERTLYSGNGQYSRDYAVAVVFVPEEHRRKGYAERLVNSVVAKYRAGAGQISLWSGIGDYYKRCGFAMADNDLRTLIIDANQASGTGKGGGEGRYLSRADMPAIVDEHRRQLLALADANEGGVVVPTMGMYSQLQERITIMQRVRNVPESQREAVFGARTGDAWMTWGFRAAKLLVLSASGSAAQIAQLLLMASTLASRLSYGVELFESTLLAAPLDDVLRNLQLLGLNAEITRRKESWPMTVGAAKWLAPGGYAWF